MSNHTALIHRETTGQLCDPAVRETAESRLLSGGSDFARLPAGAVELLSPCRAEVVDGGIPGDAKEPGGKGERPVLVAVDPLQHPAERLARQVLGVVTIPDAARKIGLDPTRVKAVETLERFAVACPSSFDERMLLSGCGRLHDPPSLDRVVLPGRTKAENSLITTPAGSGREGP
jgi:hypothetical protein